ncbi:alpha-galactosidase [Ornithinimicrobium avium]|uniref:Alpha-galactosidase n=1 Tax=Ornithinimicrobium avium TaxID=2283195 RepID=A0A345NSZ8_9MICO|nr:alpha-galactosidase [Ornithinimicrobium avium]
MEVDPQRAAVYEEGWQSWSPTRAYRFGPIPARPRHAKEIAMHFRADRLAPVSAYQGEGLLAVDPGADGPVQVFGLQDASVGVASIRAEANGDKLVISSDGPVRQVSSRGGLGAALGAWADEHAAAAGVGPLRPAPTIWCSWYQYFTQVTEVDIIENLEEMRRLELPVDVVQIDDGYQAEIGDWLDLSGRFESLPGLTARILDQGRRAGLWVAPFLVGSRSRLAAEHPDWLVSGADAGNNWGQDLCVLDVTHPNAAAYLTEVFTSFLDMGFDFFKLDFTYAGALRGRRHEDLPSITAYRRGIELIREAVGDSYLLGCGAPIFPSVGLFDGMRVGCDISATYEPHGEDLSVPSQVDATKNVEARAWQHGRFWVNDPDCLVARPDGVAKRPEWAALIERYGGLRGSSDRLAALDEWGLEVTRRLLSEVPPPTPFD